MGPILALKPTTVTAYAAHVRIFQQWLETKHGSKDTEPTAGRIASFLADRAVGWRPRRTQQAPVRAQTLRSAMCAIRLWLNTHGKDLGDEEAAQLDSKVRGLIAYTQRTGGSQREYKPLTADIIGHMVRVLTMRRRAGSRDDATFATQLAVGYCGCLRPGESALGALRWGHVRWPGRRDGHATLMIRRLKKGSQERVRAPMFAFERGAVNPTHMLRAIYDERKPDDDEPIFVYGSERTVEGIDQLRTRLRAVLEECGYEPMDYRGHDIRAGQPSDMWRNGAHELDIRQAGGWTSTGGVAPYVRPTDEARAARSTELTVSAPTTARRRQARTTRK